MTFSSPSGDGLVPHELGLNDIESWFSSPSGDGLVLTNNGYINRNLIIFVPAWGWVGSVHARTLRIGLQRIFVPAWGWVGSLSILVVVLLTVYFRPRLGMGWFGYKKQFNGSSNYHFRPRLGMSWFLPKSNNMVN